MQGGNQCKDTLHTEAVKSMQSFLKFGLLFPAERQFISLTEHVTLNEISSEVDMKAVDFSLEQQFLVSEATLPLQYQFKAVETGNSPNWRLLLEVFE